MTMHAFTVESLRPSRTGWMRNFLRWGEGCAGRLAESAKNAGRTATKHCHDHWQSVELALRSLRGLGRLERRPLGDPVVPGRELRRDAPPIGPVAPVVV